MDQSAINARVLQLHIENNVVKRGHGLIDRMDRSNESKCIPQCTIEDMRTTCKAPMWNNTCYSIPMCYVGSGDHSAGKPSVLIEINTIILENSCIRKQCNSTQVHSDEFRGYGPEGT